MLENDCVVYSAFGNQLSARVSLLVGCSFDAIVNLVFAGDGGRLLVADVAVKTFEFRIAAVYAPSTAAVGVVPGCSWMCDSGLFDFLTEFDLIDRYRLDHPGREMLTWIGSSLSGQVRSYLYRVLVRRADSDLVNCPTFHWLGWSDHKLVRVSLWLVNRPSLASNWKINTSLRKICDFRVQLENLIQRA